MPLTDEKPLTQEEAAEHLKISARTLDGLLNGDNPPPHSYLGARRRFFKSELNEWLKGRSETTAQA